MKRNDFSVMIAGEAGAGITRSGLLFGKLCLRGGLHAYGTIDYQSLIRGGHNFYVVRVDSNQVFSLNDNIDLLIALNKESILLHKNHISQGGGLIYDGENIDITLIDLDRNDLNLFSVPLENIIKELQARPIVKNSVALGATIGLLQYDIEQLFGILDDTFEKPVAEINKKAAKQGYDYVHTKYQNKFGFRLDKLEKKEKPMMFLTGNEAVALGAIQAGCKVYIAYPMTPSTSILHYLASKEREADMFVMHAENEIACVNMIIGASYAGARAMTATSGGGFSLMAEAIGMAGMIESPIVVAVSQRPGPSTGLPTYTAQGDLRFVLHVSQGEFPRVVIAPGDVNECFYKTQEAFNLADMFQIPAILLLDKHVSESHESTEMFDAAKISIKRGNFLSITNYDEKIPYKRYQFTQNGVSKRLPPGTKGAIVKANSHEHNEEGFSSEDPENRKNMVEKRFKKKQALIDELENYETTRLYGPPEADITLVGWGSTKGPIREALKLLSREKIRVNFLQLLYLEPFPTTKVSRILGSTNNIIVVEQNQSSQLSGLIRENLLMNVNKKILKYDGRPFKPKEITCRLREVM